MPNDYCVFIALWPIDVRFVNTLVGMLQKISLPMIVRYGMHKRVFGSLCFKSAGRLNGG